jgi:hypothetical protein
MGLPKCLFPVRHAEWARDACNLQLSNVSNFVQFYHDSIFTEITTGTDHGKGSKREIQTETRPHMPARLRWRRPRRLFPSEAASLSGGLDRSSGAHGGKGRSPARKALRSRRPRGSGRAGGSDRGDDDQRRTDSADENSYPKGVRIPSRMGLYYTAARKWALPFRGVAESHITLCACRRVISSRPRYSGSRALGAKCGPRT